MFSSTYMLCRSFFIDYVRHIGTPISNVVEISRRHTQIFILLGVSASNYTIRYLMHSLQLQKSHRIMCSA